MGLTTLRRITKILLVILLVYNNILISSTNNDENINSSDIESVDKKLKLFLEENNYKNLYLVFAGPYPASPTSSFGHVFLLFEPLKDTPFLLWKTLDFSADNTGTGSLDFFSKGIFGGLTGEYRIVPFFEKFREYTFIESRPLWLFKFNMSVDEKSKFLNNLFILGNNKFQYLFRNKNCASQIDSLLQTSISNSYSSENYFFFPNNLLENWADRISNPMYIESMNNIILQNLPKVSSNKYEILNLSGVELASLLNYLEWKNEHQHKHLNSKEEELLKKIRVKLSLTKLNNNNNFFKKYNEEFVLHPSILLTTGFNYGLNNHHEYLIQYRFGLHDYFENTSVYPKDDYLELFKIQLGITDSKIRLNKFLLFNQLSLQPISPLSNYLSWKISLGSERKYQYTNFPLATGLFTGIGYSFKIIQDYLNLSFLVEVSPVYLEKNGFSILYGPEFLTFLRLTAKIKFFNKTKAIFDYKDNYKSFFLNESNLSIELSNSISIISQFNYSEYHSWYTFILNYYIK